MLSEMACGFPAADGRKMGSWEGWNPLAMGSWEGWRSQPAVAPECRPRVFDSAETAFSPLAPSKRALLGCAPPRRRLGLPAPTAAWPAPTAALAALRPWERRPWPWSRDGPSRCRSYTSARPRIGLVRRAGGPSHVRRAGGPRAGALSPTRQRLHGPAGAVPLRPCPGRLRP
jgi:hypothetical protein